MRSFKLTALSLTMVFVLCAPVLAQGSPAYSQYGVEAGDFCPAGTAEDQDDGPGESVVQSVDDGACTAADNVGQGTSAVNDALAEPASSSSVSASSAASTSVASASSAESAAAGDTAEDAPIGSPGTGNLRMDGSGSGGVAAGDPEAAGVDPEGGLASITELPETGGISPPALGAGMLLVAVGLVIRRIIDP